MISGWQTRIESLRAWISPRLPRDIAIIASSPLFDPTWYRRRYPDLARTGVDLPRHYALFGGREHRDPGPAFSAAAYLEANPDVAAAGINPLVHYERYGRAEGRALRPEHSFRYDIVFVAGEPGTQGEIYRVRRPDAAARWAGLRSLALNLTAAAEFPASLNAAVVVLWRAEWSARVAAVISAARGFGAKIVFDCDDLMVEPELARVEYIDGIRTQGLTEPMVADFYARVRQTLLATDACLSPTVFLTARMQRSGKPGFVLPNGFDADTLRASSEARISRRGAGECPILRLGYAGGTRTHQKDFAVIAGPVAEVLRAGANRRLVLFRTAHHPCLDIDEFPEFAALAAQIEWRDLVALNALPWELARFDINLAPLEVGNPYCEAKSELKFFEAALAGVPTIASPTQPFRDAIRDGQNGYLAADPQTWQQRMTALLTDADLRQRLADQARADVSRQYGVERRGEILRELVGQLCVKEP